MASSRGLWPDYIRWRILSWQPQPRLESPSMTARTLSRRAIQESGGGTNPPPQTYTLTITATSGSLSQSTTTTLMVQ